MQTHIYEPEPALQQWRAVPFLSGYSGRGLFSPVDSFPGQSLYSKTAAVQRTTTSWLFHQWRTGLLWNTMNGAKPSRTPRERGSKSNTEWEKRRFKEAQPLTGGSSGSRRHKTGPLSARRALEGRALPGSSQAASSRSWRKFCCGGITGLHGGMLPSQTAHRRQRQASFGARIRISQTYFLLPLSHTHTQRHHKPSRGWRSTSVEPRGPRYFREGILAQGGSNQGGKCPPPFSSRQPIAKQR